MKARPHMPSHFSFSLNRALKAQKAFRRLVKKVAGQTWPTAKMVKSKKKIRVAPPA
jgi:hypothetical protein